MEIRKEGVISYVLVSDVTDNGQLYYYTGYYKGFSPNNTNNYVEAMKIPFKDKAQSICDKLNDPKEYFLTFKYHVEEHAYM